MIFFTTVYKLHVACLIFPYFMEVMPLFIVCDLDFETQYFHIG